MRRYLCLYLSSFTLFWSPKTLCNDVNPTSLTDAPTSITWKEFSEGLSREPSNLGRLDGSFLDTSKSGKGPGEMRLRGSGGRIRTSDLWVMSPTSCHCSTPRQGHVCVLASGCVRVRGVPAAASPPNASPRQYSPALPWVTTGFGMGPGGATALSATGTPRSPTQSCLFLTHHTPQQDRTGPAAPTTKILNR